MQSLKYVVAVAELGSISKAAESLYMSQPNLSKAISELEKSLNIAIFQRTPKGTVTTQKGKEFLQCAQRILSQFAEIELLGYEASKTSQSLRLAAQRSGYIANSFASFVDKLDTSKPVNIKFWETNSKEVIEYVDSGISDLGIIRFKAEDEPYLHSLLASRKFEFREIWSFKILLVMSSLNPLSNLRKIQIQHLYNYTEVCHTDLDALDFHEKKEDPASDIRNNRGKICVCESGTQFDLLSRNANTYMWSAPMPPHLLKKFSLIQKKVDMAGVFKDVLIYSQKRCLETIENDYIQILTETVADVEKSASENLN